MTIFLIVVLFVSLFTTLLINQLIGQATYCFLVGLTIIAALTIYNPSNSGTVITKSSKWSWFLSPDGISSIVLILTLLVLTLTFLYAYRPYVGVAKGSTSYDSSSKDLIFDLKIENVGNIPAHNVRSNMKMYVNEQQVGEELIGTSRYILFPAQITSGKPTFHGINESNLTTTEFKIIVEILYEQPIRCFIPIFKRKFKSIHEFTYNQINGGFCMTSAQAN